MVQIQTEKLPFTEYLKKLPPPWVIEHFLKEDASTRKILSSALIEDAATDFVESGKCVNRFNELTAAQKNRCILLYLSGAMGITSDAESGLHDPLAAAFLGYAARDQKGSLRIFGFERIEPVLREAFKKHLAETDLPEDQPTLPHTMPLRSLNDITVIVALASQQQLAKKKNGKLCVSALQSIRKLTHSSDAAKADDTELLANAMTGYCTSRKLLVETEPKFILNQEGFSHWLTLPSEQRLQDIRRYIVDECCGWNIDLLQFLSYALTPRRLTLSLFGENDSADARDALLLLHFCESAELQKSGGNHLFAYPQPSRRDDTTVTTHAPVIMPDFSIIIPQECPPEMLYTFARFCSMLSLDKVYHGTVVKELLTESLSGGLDGLQILTVLEQWNAPSNVLETVREWIREFQRLSLTTESTLITAEERVTEQIASCEPLMLCLERVHVHAMYRIKPGCERTVRDIVRKLGFDDRMPQVPLLPPDEEDSAPLSLFTPAPLYTLITEDTPESQKAPLSIRGTKYGAELKALELSELVQVIDYAILTGQRIVISYDGSPYVRKGIYTLTPSLCSKGVEPLLEGALQQNGVRKQFYVKKIASIGVVPQ